MQFHPRDLWFMNLAMVVISVLVMSSGWADIIGDTAARIMYQTLIGAYVILNFLTNGVKPPPPPVK